MVTVDPDHDTHSYKRNQLNHVDINKQVLPVFYLGGFGGMDFGFGRGGGGFGRGGGGRFGREEEDDGGFREFCASIEGMEDDGEKETQQVTIQKNMAGAIIGPGGKRIRRITGRVWDGILQNDLMMDFLLDFVYHLAERRQNFYIEQTTTLGHNPLSTIHPRAKKQHLLGPLNKIEVYPNLNHPLFKGCTIKWHFFLFLTTNKIAS